MVVASGWNGTLPITKLNDGVDKQQRSHIAKVCNPDRQKAFKAPIVVVIITQVMATPAFRDEKNVL